MPAKKLYSRTRQQRQQYSSETYENEPVSRSKLAARSLHDLCASDDEIWFCEETLYKDHILEVLKKWQHLDDGIWAKIICMEGNRRVAKAYARSQDIIINGSSIAFDGVTIGLAGFDNIYRDLISKNTIKSIRKGLSLHLDEEGSIWIESMTKCPIYSPDWLNIGAHKTCLGREIIENGGIINSKCKLFDMSKFHENIFKEMNSSYPDIEALKLQSIVTITFNYKGDFVLESPLSLLIINIVALDILKSRFSLSPHSTSCQAKSSPPLRGHFKSVVSKVWASIRSLASRPSSRSGLSDLTSHKNKGKYNHNSYQSLADNYLPLPYRISSLSNSHLQLSMPKFANNYKTLTIDNQCPMEPDPDYETSTTSTMSTSSQGKSSPNISSNNNGNNDDTLDWEDTPTINDIIPTFKSYGPLNSVLRALPISATLASDINMTTNSDNLSKKLSRGKSKNVINSSSISSQSSPDQTNEHIYSSIHESKDSKSSSSSNNELHQQAEE